MTLEEKKRWLWRYRDALRLEDALRDELEEQQARATRTTAAFTAMPKAASDGQTLARAVEGIVEAQQKLQAQINVCGATRREVVAAIDQLDDERDHTVLYRRYVRGQTFEQIAALMHRSTRAVIYRHNHAVEQLTF